MELSPSPSQRGMPSYGLVSLLQMLRFHADKFIEAINTLSTIENLIGAPNWSLNNNSLLLRAKLNEVIASCDDLELSVSKKKAERIASAVENPLVPGSLNAWITNSIRDLKERIEDELEGRALYYLSDRADLLDATAPFGGKPALVFPSAAYDIDEAGKCLALKRSTACVLHLMRALEHPLKAMAKAVDVPVALDNWNKILNDIEQRVRSKDKDGNRINDAYWGGREKDRDFFTEAAAHFFVIKNAWRNYATHGNKDKYTEEEAEVIYNAVKAFFQKLSERLSEFSSP